MSRHMVGWIDKYNILVLFEKYWKYTVCTPSEQIQITIWWWDKQACLVLLFFGTFTFIIKGRLVPPFHEIFSQSIHNSDTRHTKLKQRKISTGSTNLRKVAAILLLNFEQCVPSHPKPKWRREERKPTDAQCAPPRSQQLLIWNDTFLFIPEKSRSAASSVNTHPHRLLTRTDELEQDMIKRRGEKPFSCNQYIYKCTQASHLKMHI